MSDNKLKSWIYPKNSGIRIREKINTSGKEAFGISYAVTIPSKVSGKARIRKQFDEQSKAETWAQEQWNGAQNQGKVYFDATSAERNEFADVLPLLREKGISIREAVEFALPRLRPEGGDKTLAEIVEELRKSKVSMLSKGTLREHSERAFRIRSERIVEEFGEKLARDLTLPEVRIWLDGMDLAPRTIKNQLHCLSEVLRYAIARQYTADNVLERLTDGDRKEIYGNDEGKEPEILTPTEADRLLHAALEHSRNDLLGAVTLGLFCGLRTEELKKLEWKDVRLDEGFVTIGSSVAKKRRIRNVTLSPEAIQWLTCCNDRTGELTRSSSFNDYQKRFQRLLKHAGFTEEHTGEDGKKKKRVVWKKNAMRHSFGTYHFALHGDSIKTSNELGHKQGDNVLFENYRALATKKQAESYFGIVPPANANKVVRFA